MNTFYFFVATNRENLPLGKGRFSRLGFIYFEHLCFNLLVPSPLERGWGEVFYSL